MRSVARLFLASAFVDSSETLAAKKSVKKIPRSITSRNVLLLPVARNRPAPANPSRFPDIGYFNREYTLFEMMRHLYGTGPCLTPKDKPSAFEIEKTILAGFN